MAAVVYPSPILRQQIIAGAYKSPDRRVQFTSGVKDSDDDAILSYDKRRRSPLKKKRSFKGDRNSMSSRYRTGKPGTRRHQRWLNGIFLGDDFSDAESEPELMDSYYESFQELWQKPTFSYSEAYASEENKPILDSFFAGLDDSDDSDDDDNDEKYKNRKPRMKSRRSGRVARMEDNAEDSLGVMICERERVQLSARSRFNEISKKSRHALQKHSQSDFVPELENELRTYLAFLFKNASDQTPDVAFDNTWAVVDEEEEAARSMQHQCVFISTATTFDATVSKSDLSLIVHFEDSLARLMAHGMCYYYGLHSQSFNDTENKRATKIFLGDRAEARLGNLPSTTVMELLDEATKRQHDGIGGRLPLTQRQTSRRGNNSSTLDATWPEEYNSNHDDFVPAVVAVPVAAATVIAESVAVSAPVSAILPVVDAVPAEDDWTVL